MDMYLTLYENVANEFDSPNYAPKAIENGSKLGYDSTIAS